MSHPARILTIAGSDSSGGAGIQADLKTILALGGYGMSALTAITAQNTLGVFGVHAIPPETVAAQIEAVLDDPGVDAIKTGMLLNREIIEAIADVLDKHPTIPLVLDPVMIATSGARLIDEDAQELVITRLLHRATLITPNLPEADALTGLRITDQQSLEAAGCIIHDLGAKAVLIKGGHRDGEEVVDWLFDGSDWTPFRAPRIHTTGGHGTGCTLASAIATRIGQGLELKAAIESAKTYLNGALEHAWPDFGKGSGPLNHGWGMGAGPGGEWFH
jgi:hydroxymethylpyrimidine/phosphomethylpyrimidine kinase